MSATYLTVKLVEVKPMLAIDAENEGYRTNDVPSETPGYKVLYQDGYKSWCPKNVFDINSIKLTDLKSFNIICGNNFPDHIKRMFVEHNELEARIDKSLDFFKSDDYYDLSNDRQDLLNKQHMFMLGYLNVLRERIINEINIFTK